MLRSRNQSIPRRDRTILRALFFRLCLGLLMLLLVLPACSPTPAPAGLDLTTTPANPPPLSSTSTPTPFMPATHTPVPTPTPVPDFGLWIDPALPLGMHAQLNLPGEMNRVADPGAAAFRLQLSSRPLEARIPLETVDWVYALVAPFPTLTDGISLPELQDAWKGTAQGEFAGQPILISPSTLQALEPVFGPPAEQGVRLLSDELLLTQAWDTRPAWAIVPFEDLEPAWKVLALDGQSPLLKDFDPATYPLTISFTLAGSPVWANAFQDLLSDSQITRVLPEPNRNPDQLTVLIMTGVTAMVRATAWMMDIKGVTYPARDIGEILQAADITHISNEVAFAENCPLGNPRQTSLTFCSRPEYIELLEAVGADVIELTGNHANDWGRGAMAYSLELYRQNNFQYYAGGDHLDEARQPLIVEHNGNRLAFIGCNPVGPGGAWATQTGPGAASCDYAWMHAQIQSLRSQDILPIATFQHFESYTPKPLPGQVEDFRGMALAGAAIVSGSQSHYPQAFELNEDSFIHYGLGNLFFDQQYISNPSTGAIITGTAWEFADRHIFHQGRHISTEVLTFMLEDWSKPRPMTPAERQSLLTLIFRASGW